MDLVDRISESDLSGLPDWKIAEILNAPDTSLPPRRSVVMTSDVRALLLRTGEWAAIKMLSRATPSENIPAEAVGAALISIDTLELTTILESDKEEFYNAMAAMVAGLKQAGVLSEQSGNAMLAMAEKPQSWAQINNVFVDARAVGLARGGI